MCECVLHVEMSVPRVCARAFLSPSVYVTVAAGASRTCRRVCIFVKLQSANAGPVPCNVHEFSCVILDGCRDIH